MVKGLQFTSTTTREDETLEAISNNQGIPDVQALWGINNFIQKVEANSTDLLKDIIKTDLKLAMEVSNLLTLIIADSPGKQLLR